MHQGIGLFLCKNLVELMGGEIYLDPEYNSGVPGSRGTRFVVDLRMAPLDGQFSLDHPDLAMFDKGNAGRLTPKGEDESASPTFELPEKLSV
jgi:hypothetical protein